MKEIKTTLQSIACGGTGGEITAVDTMDGKILRIRPFRNDTAYTKEELAPSMWKIDVDGKVFEPSIKTCPNWIALAYKNRVYSRPQTAQARRLGAGRRSREDQFRKPRHIEVRRDQLG